MLAYLMICVDKSVKENKLSKGMRVVSHDSPILKSIFCAQLLKGERILREKDHIFAIILLLTFKHRRFGLYTSNLKNEMEELS